MTYLELLAPARDISIGIAAIDCGADAIYIAGPDFGARKAASNSIEDIEKLCNYAHLFGARVFITLNTIIYEEELDKAYKVLLDVQRAGADAIIVQDMAILEFAKKTGFNLPVHASTQCAIRTEETALQYESLGFSRLVLERELSLSTIKKIHSTTKCELEFFVHGALCVCYSGQCYLSEKITKRSANRGECIQACRSKYDLTDSNGNILLKDKAILSLKDLNLKNRLEDLADAGICSFKIEGRLKNISYVKNVVREYSLAIDEICKKQPEKYRRASFGEVYGGFTPAPDKTFNRGYTELFIDGKRVSWAAMDTPKSMGEKIGIVKSIRKVGKDTMEILIKPLINNLELRNGDGFSFVGKNDIIGFRGDLCNDNRIITKSIIGLKEGIILYRNISVAFEKELENNKCTRYIKAGINISINHYNESTYKIIAKVCTEDGRCVESKFDVNQERAENVERMKNLILSQLSKKTGIYDFFTFKDEIYKLEDIPYMSTAFLNSIRRDLAAKLDMYPCIKIPLQTGIQGNINLKEKDISYKYNIANHIAESVYKSNGADSIEKAYELTHRSNIELMRTKYCVRFEIGRCPKYQKGKDNSPLYITNNGRRLSLHFDCKKCEMTVEDN